jgi:cation diffusion facilitator family transporter
MIADPDDRRRLRAGIISLAVGSALMAGKFLAYKITGSSAVFSDALESIVNVVAAAFAIGSILFAGRPADRGHPYGHGKMEYFSAAFEGGLISFAALAIGYQAVTALLHPPVLRQIDTGLGITASAGVVNALLGFYLLRVGRQTNSLILVADGKHVLSDSWTTLGVVVGLLLVRFTGVRWLDPLVALIVALNLARTGLLLVRHAARALLDEEDTELLERMIKAGEKARRPGIIRIHHLRAIRMGRFVHVDAHLVVPEFWSISHSHEQTDAFASRLLDLCSCDGEIAFHADPCERQYCEVCDLPDCPIRKEPFRARPRLTIDEATRPEETTVRAKETTIPASDNPAAPESSR